MKSTNALLCILASAVVGSAQAASANPQPGEPAAAQVFEDILGGVSPADATLDALSGKVVVLEFWATWCAPCIASMPHLIELDRAFADKPVQFISVTSEPREKVERFVRKRGLPGWAAVDADRSLFEAYDVAAIPHTIIIDADGVVASRTHANKVTAELLDKIIGGGASAVFEPETTESEPDNDASERMKKARERMLGLPPAEKGAEKKKETKSEAEKESTRDKLLRMAKEASQDKSAREPKHTIKPTESTTSMTRYGPAIFRASSTTIEQGLLVSLGLSDATLLTEAPLPEGRFKIDIVPPEGQPERMKEYWDLALRDAFGLTIRTQQRPGDVYVLGFDGAFGPDLNPALGGSGHSGTADGVLVGANQATKALIKQLTGPLGLPIIDDTVLTEKYDWDLAFTEGDRDSLVAAVREQLGLTIRQERRDVDVVIVSKASSGAGSDN